MYNLHWSYLNPIHIFYDFFWPMLPTFSAKNKHFPAPILPLRHRIRIHRRATRVGAFEVFEAAHVALRTLLAFSQPVNCIFWPIGMLNWLVAASKLHKHRVTCCTAEWPFYSFLILCLHSTLTILSVNF